MSDTEPLPSSQRFSARVPDYLCSRPGYTPKIVSTLIKEVGEASNLVVADIGSGTGLLSKPFLDAGCHVFGVEPGTSMREGAVEYLQDYPAFENMDGSAEATGLIANSVDAVVAGQSFHWFDPASTRTEWLRISKTEAVWAVIWNLRRRDTTPFLQGYDALLHKWGTDYTQVSASWEDSEALRVLFGNDNFQRLSFDMTQSLDFDGLKGLLLSFSYIPGSDDMRYTPMLKDLADLFQHHARAGLVKMEYDTVMYYGAPTI